VRRLPAVHRRLRLRRHRPRCRHRPCRQVRHLRRLSGLRAGLSARCADLRHHLAHLQRGRRLGRPVRAGPRRLPGLQYRTADAPHPAPCRTGHRAGDAAGLRAGHGFGRLQRHHRHQDSGVPSAADQHRGHAGRRQAPVQAGRARCHGAGHCRRRRRVGRGLPVAVGCGRAQRADPVHGGRQRGLHEYRHAAFELHALRRLDLDHAGRAGHGVACPRRARRRTPRTCR
jgi:hypothetical protein